MQSLDIADDQFICATGTGGTLAGVTRYMVEKSNGRVEGWLADPPGSVLYNVVEKGKAERVGTGSITEGESSVGRQASLVDPSPCQSST